MNWAFGALNGTSLESRTSMHIFDTIPHLRRKKTLMIEMRSMLCKDSKSIMPGYLKLSELF